MHGQALKGWNGGIVVSIHFRRFQDAFAWSERRCLAAFARRTIANEIQRGIVFRIDH